MEDTPADRTKGSRNGGDGYIERGVIKANDSVEVVGFGETRHTVVTRVEMGRKPLDLGQAGDHVGCVLRGIEKHEIVRGQVLAKPGSITSHKKFLGEVYVLRKEEGGRPTPLLAHDRPHFYLRTTDVTGTFELPEGVEKIMPGDNVLMTVSLHVSVALEEQMRFAVREDYETVAVGVVTKVLA